MANNDLYKINLKSLKEGKHHFEYLLQDSYFADLQVSIGAGEVEAEVVCDKQGELYKLQIRLDGYVVSQCDRCLDELEIDVYSERELIVKLGAELLQESDEVLILPEREGVLDLSWLLWEDIALSLPIQHMHLEEQECDSSMMQIYRSMQAEELPEEEQAGTERDADGIDQRWAALKALKNE